MPSSSSGRPKSTACTPEPSASSTPRSQASTGQEALRAATPDTVRAVRDGCAGPAPAARVRAGPTRAGRQQCRRAQPAPAGDQPQDQSRQPVVDRQLGQNDSGLSFRHLGGTRLGPLLVLLPAPALPTTWTVTSSGLFLSA